VTLLLENVRPMEMVARDVRAWRTATWDNAPALWRMAFIVSKGNLRSDMSVSSQKNKSWFAWNEKMDRGWVVGF
jgi:hypothetical protein